MRDVAPLPLPPPAAAVAAPPRHARGWRRALKWAPAAARFLLLGAVVNVVVAFGLALGLDVSRGQMQTVAGWTGQDMWTVTRWSRPGALYVLSAREGTQNWSPGQACGPPDTLLPGDKVTAWASATTDLSDEWLTLEFAEAVVPAAVRVYETCAPGALSKVSVFKEDGQEVEAWKGVDPTPTDAKMGISVIPLSTGFATKKVKLYIDSMRVPNWNEVDAVALVGVDGRQQWAVSAEASSVYGAPATAPIDAEGPASLAPEWSGLGRPPAGARPGSKIGGAEAVEARGWPMLTLWANVGAPPASSQAVAPTPVSLGGPGGRGGGNVMAFSPGGYLAVGGAAPAGVPGAPVSGRAALPLRPVWGGFLANTLFYAVALFLLNWALTVPLRFVREVARLRRGCCVACGYDLGFDFVAGCPECGWRRRGR